MQEAQLLTSPEELEKIQLLKERFEPSNLPLELIQSGEYICGTLINKQEVWRKHQDLFRRQHYVAVPNSALAGPGPYWGGSYAQAPGAYPTHAQYQGTTTSSNPQPQHSSARGTPGAADGSSPSID